MHTGQTRDGLIHEVHPVRRGWFVALFLAAVLTLLSARPTAAQSEGHWKLVNVSNSGTSHRGLDPDRDRMVTERFDVPAVKRKIRIRFA